MSRYRDRDARRGRPLPDVVSPDGFAHGFGLRYGPDPPAEPAFCAAQLELCAEGDFVEVVGCQRVDVEPGRAFHYGPHKWLTRRPMRNLHGVLMPARVEVEWWPAEMGPAA